MRLCVVGWGDCLPYFLPHTGLADTRAQASPPPNPIRYKLRGTQGQGKAAFTHPFAPTGQHIGGAGRGAGGATGAGPGPISEPPSLATAQSRAGNWPPTLLHLQHHTCPRLCTLPPSAFPSLPIVTFHEVRADPPEPLKSPLRKDNAGQTKPHPSFSTKKLFHLIPSSTHNYSFGAKRSS